LNKLYSVAIKKDGIQMKIAQPNLISGALNHIYKQLIKKNIIKKILKLKNKKNFFLINLSTRIKIKEKMEIKDDIFNKEVFKK
jgi:hypothetical protein